MKKVSIIKCWLFVLFLLFFAVSSLNLSFLHFRYELEKMKVENELTRAKIKAYESAEDIKEKYENAIRAMRHYSGNGDKDEY